MSEDEPNVRTLSKKLENGANQKSNGNNGGDLNQLKTNSPDSNRKKLFESSGPESRESLIHKTEDPIKPNAVGKGNNLLESSASAAQDIHNEDMSKQLNSNTASAPHVPRETKPKFVNIAGNIRFDQKEEQHHRLLFEIEEMQKNRGDGKAIGNDNNLLVCSASARDICNEDVSKQWNSNTAIASRIPQETKLDIVNIAGNQSFNHKEEKSRLLFLEIEEMQKNRGHGKGTASKIINNDLVHDAQLSTIPQPQCVIEELITTEITYIEQMKFVIDNYLTYFLTHPIKKRDFPEIAVIFGNIESLHDRSSQFLMELSKCDKTSVDSIANVFLQSEDLYQLYAEYLKNHAQTDEIMRTKYKIPLSERYKDLGGNISCEGYLVAPVQRPPRHKMLLEILQKELTKLHEENKSLQAAIHFVDLKIQEANTLLTIHCIRECPVDLKKFGGMCLLSEKFKIKREYTARVFLFEQIVVFTTKNKNNRNMFDYKDSINTIDLKLTENEELTSFTLYDNPKSLDFELETPTESIYRTWVDKINTILWEQANQLKRVETNRRPPTEEGPVLKNHSVGSVSGLNCAIKELIETERTYLINMRFVIDNYLKYYLKNDKLPKIVTIFGNIESLYDSNQKLLEQLLKCNSSIDCIANIFLQSKHLLELHAEYIRNRNETQGTLEKIYRTPLTERQRELNDIESCESYLSEPAQRPTKYKLLLENIRSELKRLGQEYKLLDVAIRFVDQHIDNSCPEIESIVECPINLKRFGGLFLLKNRFNVKIKYNTFKTKALVSMVFLFEDVIVFTTETKDNPNTFDYINSINTIDLLLTQNGTTRFTVNKSSKSKKQFEIETSSEDLCKTWVDKITSILFTQFSHLKRHLKTPA